MTQAKNTICLWYDKDALAAANFYAATFPDSEVTAVNKAPGSASANSDASRSDNMNLALGLNPRGRMINRPRRVSDE